MEIAARDEYVTSRENLCKMEKGNWLGIEVPERERESRHRELQKDCRLSLMI